MLQTGPMKKKVPKKVRSNTLTGFTLIELLIVAAIILVLTSFSTPLFRKTFTDLELKETASNISKFIAFAQQQAVIDEAIYKISFDFENKKYRLLVSGEEGGMKFKSTSGRFGRVFNLPRDIDIDGEKNEILFYPDGRSDKVELKLISKDSKVLRITTTGVLGNVIVEQEK